MDTGQLEDPIPAGACETLPARYCTDREIFAEETEKILAGTWHLVGHRSQVAEKGDTFRWIPVGLDETKVEVDWWLESAEPRSFERDLIEQHARTTFPEDIPLVESVQHSMRSWSFDRGFVLVDRDRSQASEHGVKAFHDLYLRHMSGPDA